MGEIKTKSVYYDPVDKTEGGDGFRVLIMRYWPRPLTRKQVADDRSFTDLAPSRELHRDWRNRKENGMDWSDFTRRILEEFANNPQAQLRIEWLRKKSQSMNVTLLCVEPKENPYCHRYIVKALIEGKLLV
jgi:uncharacterized protein YeaO (DUF488 family)